jgi:leucine-zipper-like transcriptional regulator 1
MGAMVTFSVSLLASHACGQQAPALKGTWVQVTPQAAFSPRDTSEDVVFGGKMWLSNAYHVGNVLVRDLWCSEDGANWTLVSDNTPYDGYSEMVVYRDRIWAVKGSVWASADGVRWERVAETTPFGVRGYGELVVFQDRMWQLGSGEDVWHTTDGINWTCATDRAPYGKRYGTAVAA